MLTGMDPVTLLLDQVGRLNDSELLAVAAASRRHTRDPAVEDARRNAFELLRSTDGLNDYEERAAALRRWAGHSEALGELAADTALPPRTAAFPVLADALLGALVGPRLDDRSRHVLSRDWRATRPSRFDD